MKKSELIERLHTIPGDPEVCLMDFKKNINSDSGDGSGEGIYPKFDVEMVTTEDVTDDSEPFLAISFDNPDIED